MKKKRNTMSFSSYEQTLFNKYEIDESYLQTKKQQRACLELLEQIDKNQVGDEKELLDKVRSAFRGSKFHVKIASCVSLVALMTTLQSAPVMAKANYIYQSSSQITQELSQAKTQSGVVIDQDSFVNQNVVSKKILNNTSLHLLSTPVLKNNITAMGSNGVMIDGDSDVSSFEKQETKTLTVIDTNVEEFEVLKDGIKSGEVLILDNDGNPLEQILNKVKEINQVDCINIISHGSQGRIQFNNSEISLQDLEQNQAIWKSIGSYLSQDGDIQLYGCNIAKGEEGSSFIRKLAELTGADIAASINATGAEAKGGDWDLEMEVGDVESDLPFARNAISNFSGLLALVAGSNHIDLNQFQTVGSYYTFLGSVLGDSNFRLTADDGTSTFNQMMYKSGTGGVNINYILNPTTMTMKISPKDGTVGPFELENLSLYNYSNSIDMQIVGYKTNGEQIIVNKTSESFLYDKTSFSDWAKFDNIQLDSFAVKFQYNGVSPVSALHFWSFDINTATEAAATATNVKISGTPAVGQTLTGSYTYSDINKDAEGISTYKWYRSNNAAGSGKTLIPGATGKTYKLTSADAGKYISFEVTPVALFGTKTGTPVESAKSSAVVSKVSNITLSATSLNLIAGNKATLKVTGILPVYATNKNVKWSSSNTAVASVSDTGIINAKKAGNVTITCTAADGSNTKATCNLNITQSTSSVIKAGWKKINGAAGYRVKLYKGSKVINTRYVASNAITLKSLDAGTSYKLVIDSYALKGTTKVYGNKIATIKTATSPNRSKLSGKAGSKATTLSWKTVAGASGYEISMSSQKAGSFTVVKTVTSGKTIKYTKTKLVKGKTYYFKIRAYKKVDGQKVYGGYSNVSSVKVK